MINKLFNITLEKILMDDEVNFYKNRSKISIISSKNNMEDISFSMMMDKNIKKSESISIQCEENNSNESSDDFEDKIQNMMTAETPPDPFINIQTRTRLRWVDDSSTQKCGLCNEKFRIFLRRHHCVPAGTLITLANGTSKKIENIRINDRVASWNNKIVFNCKVDAVIDQGYKKCMIIRLENDQNFIATADHKILSSLKNDLDYIEMSKLTIKHKVIIYDDNNYQYISISSEPQLYKNGEPQHVYDLSVPGNRSFVANGVVVHNCRTCGDVFCGSCSNNWNIIPECITHIPSSNGIKTDINRDTLLRMCDMCNKKIDLVKKLEVLLKSVQLVEMDIFAFKAMGENSDNADLTDSFIKNVNNIPDMNQMKENQVISFAKSFMDGKLWKQLANFYLSKFREIQYKLPYQDYTEWERNALWTNRKYLKGHDIWTTHLIRSHIYIPEKLDTIVHYMFDDLDDNEIMIKDKDACWQRMCTRLCQPKFSWESSLMLLDILSKIDKNIRDIVTNVIVNSFNQCDDDIFECILPCITYRLVHDDLNEIMIEYVISRAKKSIRISNHIYWAFTIEKENDKMKKICDYLISRLFRELPKNIYDIITGVNNFVHTIETKCSNDRKNPIKDREKIGIIVSPTHPEIGRQKVSNKIFQVEKSANNPIPIVITPIENEENENTELYKKEDLRTDQIVMSIIRIMKKILEEKLEKNLHVVTYHIQPTSSDSGFIGVVNNCKTLYRIEEKLKISISNYIKKHNPDVPTHELTVKFLNSSAFYSVITFLLGIGDRHLDNIMLNDSGEIFHIDYGFVLGKDPKPMKTPAMRISEGMLDAIGGFHSESYQQFKDLCYDIYEISRRHVNTFVCLLSLLPKQNTGGTRTNPKISDKRVLREIVKRFAPGETCKQARTILHTRIDKSSNITNRSKYHIVDFFHRHNKEKTLTNVLTYTLSSTYNGTANMVQGIWDYVSNIIR